MKRKRGQTGNTFRPKILGTGLIALDVVMNSATNRPPFFGVGGTCGNVLTILSFLGWESYPVARLNDGPASMRIKQDLQQWNVNLKFASSEPTTESPVIIHTIKVNGLGEPYHRFSFNCPTCGSWLPNYKAVVSATANIVSENISDQSIFFFDRPSRASIMLAETTTQNGGVVVFEPIGVGNKKLFREALLVSHIVKYSDERFQDSPIDAHGVTPRLLEIQTLGAKGLRFRRKGTAKSTAAWHRVDALRAERIGDTAGAGDWCTAGMIDAICRQGLGGFKLRTAKDIETALMYGQALAAWNCQFEGARGGMYHLMEKKYAEELKLLISRFNPENEWLKAEFLTWNFPQTQTSEAFDRPSSICGKTAPLKGACCF